MAVHHSSERQDHGTPGSFFRWVDRDFGFTVDVCAEKWNAKLPRFFDPKRDGLRQSWSGEVVWCNPPYSMVDAWTAKGVSEVLEHPTIAVYLVPSRTDAAWWRTATEGHGRIRRSSFHQPSRVWWLAYREITVGIYHHDARLSFDLPPDDPNEQESAPFPSSLLFLLPRRRWPPNRFDLARRARLRGPTIRHPIESSVVAKALGLEARHIHLFDRPGLLTGQPGR